LNDGLLFSDPKLKINVQIIKSKPRWQKIYYDCHGWKEKKKDFKKLKIRIGTDIFIKFQNEIYSKIDPENKFIISRLYNIQNETLLGSFKIMMDIQTNRNFQPIFKKKYYF